MREARTSGAMRDARGADSEVEARGAAAGQLRAETPTSVVVPAGTATLGAERDDVAFGWDNEFDAHDVHVPAFDIDTLPVTNAQYLEFINAGGYGNRELWSDEGWEWIQADRVQHPAFWIARVPDPRPPIPDPRLWQWRGMFEPLPLSPDWPVYVSQAEASAYARWKGRRLMTEPEFHRAAEGSTTGHFDFAGFDPIPVGSHPPSAAGVYDLVGNGWEWTSTVFAPFDGFVPMRSYPGILGRLLRRPPLRHEGGVPGDGAGARAPQLPKLVPRELPIRLCEVPDRRVRGPIAEDR